MATEAGVLGVFSEPAVAAAAIRALHAKGFTDVRAAMPAPFPEVMDAVGAPQSKVGIGVLVSTLLGAIGGFALCISTSLAWPLVTGGKPIVSLPAYVVIAFESSVLVGGSFTHLLLAFATVTGRWRRRMPIADPRFSTDRIGVFAVGESREMEALLQASGAEEVGRVA
jgi:hypothetical protein